MTVFFCIVVDFKLDFIRNFPWIIFLFGVFFFANYCHLLSFLKNSQNCNVTNFYIINNLFHHKDNDKNFSKGKKKQVFLRSQFPCKVNVAAKPVSLRSQCPYETNIWCRSSLSFYCRSHLLHIGLFSSYTHSHTLLLFYFVLRAKKKR